MGKAIRLRCLHDDPGFRPGDLPPEGYLAWHSWAEMQRKAGIGQTPCSRCGRWRTPQELDQAATDAAGAAVCRGCAAQGASDGAVCLVR